MDMEVSATAVLLDQLACKPVMPSGSWPSPPVVQLPEDVMAGLHSAVDDIMVGASQSKKTRPRSAKSPPTAAIACTTSGIRKPPVSLRSKPPTESMLATLGSGGHQAAHSRQEAGALRRCAAPAKAAATSSSPAAACGHAARGADVHAEASNSPTSPTAVRLGAAPADAQAASTSVPAIAAVAADERWSPPLSPRDCERRSATPSDSDGGTDEEEQVARLRSQLSERMIDMLRKPVLGLMDDGSMDWQAERDEALTRHRELNMRREAAVVKMRSGGGGGGEGGGGGGGSAKTAAAVPASASRVAAVDLSVLGKGDGGGEAEDGATIDKGFVSGVRSMVDDLVLQAHAAKRVLREKRRPGEVAIPGRVGSVQSLIPPPTPSPHAPADAASGAWGGRAKGLVASQRLARPASAGALGTGARLMARSDSMPPSWMPRGRCAAPRHHALDVPAPPLIAPPPAVAPLPFDGRVPSTTSASRRGASSSGVAARATAEGVATQGTCQGHTHAGGARHSAAHCGGTATHSGLEHRGGDGSYGPMTRARPATAGARRTTAQPPQPLERHGSALPHPQDAAAASGSASTSPGLDALEARLMQERMGAHRRHRTLSASTADAGLSGQ